MPICMLYTNKKDSEIPANFEETLAQAVAKVLQKPLMNMNTVILPGQRIYRRQSNAPACLLHIHSIGVFDAERNPTYTPALIDFLSSSLQIETDRIMIQYLPLLMENVGQQVESK